MIQKILRGKNMWGLGVALALLPLPLLAGGPECEAPAPESSQLRFIENQGQWNPAFRYLSRFSGGEIFFAPEAISYRFYQLPDDHGHGRAMEGEAVYREHVLRVRFEGASAAPAVEAAHRFPEYHNYFIGNYPSKWAGGVPLYGVLSYRGLYPGTDLRLYGCGDGIKYDFLLAPGADPSAIALRYEGADRIRLDKGALRITTSIREIVEAAPVAWQPDGGQNRPVACQFRLEGSLLRFEFPEGYDPALPIVIDPTLVFSTYSGASVDNWGFTATYDEQGNAYAGGILRNQFGTGTYPTTPGAFQTAYAGGTSDVVISKFSPNGSQLLYSTYLGGPAGPIFTTSYEEQPHSMIVSPAGQLVVFGRTNSPNFPVTNGAYDLTPNGGFDLFVARFSADGTSLIASTYVGGNGDDGVNGETSNSVPITYTNTKYNYGDDARGEVMLDAAGNVYVAACTKSSNFPAINGFDASYGGNQDGCVFKLSPGLNSLLFSSFLGGSGEDAAYSVKLDDFGNIFVAGGTASSNFPAANGLDITYNGGTDGFAVRINPAGNAVLNATFLGTTSYDQVFLLEIDRNNNVYVVGQSTGSYPVQSSPSGPVYQNLGAKQFIHRLSNNLSSTVFSTVFGSVNAPVPNISPTAMLVDRCDNIYVTGWGGFTNNQGNVSGMPITPDALDANASDGSDFYMIVLSRNAQSLVYASYIGGNDAPGASGGDHVDGGTSRFDKNGIIYHAVCAGCWANSNFPSTPGVWSTTNGALNPAGCNMAVFKLSFDLSGVEADFVPRDALNQPIDSTQEGCAPFLVNFENTSELGATPGNVVYTWDFGDGSPASNQFQPSHVYQAAGTYQVRLIVTDSTSCNISDSTFRTIVVFPPPDVDAGPDISVCQGDTVQLFTASVGTSYLWAPSAGFLSASTVPNPLAIVSQTTAFVLTLTDANGCSASDTVVVSADNSFSVNAGADASICLGGNIQLNASAPGAISYAWSASPAANFSSLTLSNPLVTGLDTTTFFYVTARNAIGCERSDTLRVDVFEVQVTEDTAICRGVPLQLSASNGVSFSWSPNDGSLSSTSIANPVANPQANTTYTVTAVSADGCVSSKAVAVAVLPLPQANAGPDAAICIGDSLRLSASGGQSYLWAPADGFSPSDPRPVVSPLASTRYVLTVFDANGCSDQDTVLVSVNPLPSVSAGPDVSICAGDTAQLQASGALSYEWLPLTGLSNPAIANPLAFPAQTTRYLVIGLDANGCQDSDTVQVSVVDRPLTTVSGINRVCVGGEIELRASGGERYLWSTGDTSAVIRVSPTQAATYIATAFIGQCEGIPDSIEVDVNFDFPQASFSLDPASGYAPQQVQFSNTSVNGFAWAWNFGFGQGSQEENPVFVFPAAGTYTITLIAISEGGCQDTAFQTLTLENVTLHVPSAFTPNADDVNDEFLVGYQGISSLSVRIYSRWGMLVFESDNKDFRWNGTYRMRPVPEGVYVYHITGEGENGQNFEKRGTVTVLR